MRVSPILFSPIPYKKKAAAPTIFFVGTTAFFSSSFPVTRTAEPIICTHNRNRSRNCSRSYNHKYQSTQDNTSPMSMPFRYYWMKIRSSNHWCSNRWCNNNRKYSNPVLRTRSRSRSHNRSPSQFHSFHRLY